MSGEHGPRKFIIDTDPGVDDAMAITMALEAHRRGEIEILAFTLVAGNTKVENQPTNILRLLRLVPECFGQIPVYVGANEGIVHKFVHPTGTLFHGTDGFCNVKFDDDPMEAPDKDVIKEEHAAIAIMRLVNQFPEQITVVTLGPLTNLALAFKLDKTLADKINHIYMMGGNTEGGGNITATAEFNFFADPEGAHVVFKRLEALGQVKVTLIGLEVCQKNFLPWEWRKNVLGEIGGERIKLLNALDEAQRSYTRYKERWTPYDQYAMAVALDRTCIKKSTEYNAGVELNGELTRGLFVLEKRLFLRQNNKEKPFNVEIVEELEMNLVKEQIFRGMEEPK